jgi:hypothetical protein
VVTLPKLTELVFNSMDIQTYHPDSLMSGCTESLTMLTMLNSIMHTHEGMLAALM